MLRKRPLFLVPRSMDGGGGFSLPNHAVNGVEQRPGIIQIEGLLHQVRLRRFAEQQTVRLDGLERCPNLRPEVRGHLARGIEAESIDIIGTHPEDKHVGDIATQLWVAIIESRDVCPVVGIENFAGRVMLIEVGVLHQRAVPRGVVQDHIKDHAHMSLVSFRNQPEQVLLCAVRGTDPVVITYRIRAAQGAFFLFLAGRIDGHQPQHIHAKMIEVVEACRDAIKIAFGREVARKDLVDDGAGEPGWSFDRSGRGPRRCSRADRGIGLGVAGSPRRKAKQNEQSSKRVKACASQRAVKR